MFKQIATISVVTLMLTGCVTPDQKDTAFIAQPAVAKSTQVINPQSAKDIIEVSRDLMEQTKLSGNREKIATALIKLKSHVGKTWYVFSGNTPSGWDCSGLTMWFYEQLGVELEHRASKQDTAGTKAKDPKPGDIVVFKYKGYNDAYHVGIYLGNGQMIHAPKHGHLTRVEDISTFGGSYSDISYRRIIDSL